MAAFVLYMVFLLILFCKIVRELCKKKMSEMLIRIVKEDSCENIFLWFWVGEQWKNGLELLGFMMGSKTSNKIFNHVMLLLSQKEMLLGKSSSKITSG